MTDSKKSLKNQQLLEKCGIKMVQSIQKKKALSAQTKKRVQLADLKKMIK